jgi:hypothetical protein
VRSGRRWEVNNKMGLKSYGNWGNSVTIVSDYRLEDRATGNRSPVEARNFSRSALSLSQVRTFSIIRATIVGPDGESITHL